MFSISVFFPSLLGEQIGLVNDMAVSSSCTVSFFATTMWESVLGTSCPSLKRQKPGGDGFFFICRIVALKFGRGWFGHLGRGLSNALTSPRLRIHTTRQLGENAGAAVE